MTISDDMRSLAQEIAGAYEDRVESIAVIRQETADFLNDSHKAHQEMAKELRAQLANVKPELETAESDRMAADQAEIREREAYIGNLLDDFGKAHQEMAKELRAQLANVKPELETAESDRKATDQAEISERKWAISSMLEEFRKGQAETSSAWKELLVHMQSLRGQVTITGAAGVEATAEAKPVEEAIEEPVEEAEEEGLEEEEKTALKDQILDVLGDNPDGLRMTDIADILGIENWRSLIPVIGELLDENEIIKEDSTYYIA